MAQTLKDEVKERIVESAKREFLTNGYEKSSMRSIAIRSHMTVGNLYRYFNSKEDLLRYIVSDTYGQLNEVVSKITNNEFTMSSDSVTALPVESLASAVEPLSTTLSGLYINHPTELNILMMESDLNQSTVEWFTNVVIATIDSFDPEMRSKEVLARAYSTAIFNGAKEILKTPDLDQETVRESLDVFFNSFLFMLQKGLTGEQE